MQAAWQSFEAAFPLAQQPMPAHCKATPRGEAGYQLHWTCRSLSRPRPAVLLPQCTTARMEVCSSLPLSSIAKRAEDGTWMWNCKALQCRLKVFSFSQHSNQHMKFSALLGESDRNCMLLWRYLEQASTSILPTLSWNCSVHDEELQATTSIFT